MLPFNKRPGRDPRDDAPEGETTDRALQRSSRAVPPPARSQPRAERFEEEPVQPVRPFQASRSDEEVTTFMASPAKKPAGAPIAHNFDETGETATALHYVRPPAPSEPDEEEDSHTQIRHMPRRGRAAPPVQAQPRGKEPPVVRLDPRAEVSLSLSSAVLEEDHETGANAPDFTVQLGPGPGPAPATAAPAPAPLAAVLQPPVAPQAAPAPIVHAPPQPFPVQAAPPPAVPHTFSPVTSAPLVSRSQPPMGLAPGAALPAAMRSGPVPAMTMPSAMQSGPVASVPAHSHAPFASPAHFSVPPSRPLDPPAVALSTSHAAPKPARVWAMALVAVGAAAALAAFALRGSPTVAAFVDPSRAPGGRAAPAEAAPGAQPPQPVQVQAVQPSQPSNAALAPVTAPVVTAQVVGVQPVQPVNPPVALPAQPAVAVGVAQPALPVAAAAPEPKPAAAAAPKPVAAKPEPKPVAAKPEPKPVAAKPEPKEPKGAKKPATAAEKEMKDAADALARAQLEQSL